MQNLRLQKSVWKPNKSHRFHKRLCFCQSVTLLIDWWIWSSQQRKPICFGSTPTTPPRRTLMSEQVNIKNLGTKKLDISEANVEIECFQLEVSMLFEWFRWASEDMWLHWSSFQDPSAPGVSRGTCRTTTGKPAYLREKYPTARVKYSKIKAAANMIRGSIMSKL